MGAMGRPDPDRAAAMAKAYASGATLTAIVLEHGICRQRVTQILRKAGVAIRPGGRRRRAG
jgi:hypothetical protein